MPAFPASISGFREALGQPKERYPFRLYGYCLLANHEFLLPQAEAASRIWNVFLISEFRNVPVHVL